MSIQRMLEGARFRQVAKVVLAALLAFVLSQGTRNEYAMFAMLGWYTWQQQPKAILALVGIGVASFVAEAIYRKASGRTIRLGA